MISTALISWLPNASSVVLTYYSLRIPPTHYQVHHILIISYGVVTDAGYSMIFSISIDVLDNLVDLGVGNEISIA